ncbi:hypothetical protein G6F22_020834 [Rhizopus arrhizus]|uniref:Uncharacterized protein n=1 Tax=Rhizopus delemar TaxID=936053 RepID=A0A9P7C1Q9_9FUNG|nr:hypothetical protein G6F22_020834 [Rhizopus arrhizus]KAG1256751.1 hypothetical protein G6F65_016195 [Rhizopus arrhizus]KAG1531296.1 hypothetical protein G6F50_016776 [Rhizopus delemar]
MAAGGAGDGRFQRIGTVAAAAHACQTGNVGCAGSSSGTGVAIGAGTRGARCAARRGRPRPLPARRGAAGQPDPAWPRRSEDLSPVPQ